MASKRDQREYAEGRSGGREYARVLSVAAARAPAEGDITMLNEHAVGAIAVERSLHELLHPLRA